MRAAVGTRTLQLGVVLCLAGLTGCGSDSPGAGPEAVQDAGSHDANAEVADDAQVDPDVQPDAVVDAPTDQGDEPVSDAPEEGDAGDPSFAVLSLNLHCLKLEGTTFADQTARFAAIASAVAQENVHAIMLQEVCTTPAVEALAALQHEVEVATGTSWSSAYGFAHVGWAGTPDEADEGLAVMVRDAMGSSETLHHLVQGSLERVAVFASPSSGPLAGLHLMSVHLDYAEALVREAQAVEAASFALSRGDSLNVLIAGDFNAQPGSATHQALVAQGYLDLTASLQADRIDHVFLHRGAGLSLIEAAEVFNGSRHPVVSDHPGMLVRLRASSGEAVPMTRLIGEANLGSDEILTARGDVAPLSWTRGLRAAPADDSRWRLVVTEIPAGQPFAFKFLRNDVDWQAGENQQGVGGQETLTVTGF